MSDVDNYSTANDKYILNRDLTASIRLNSQHYIWQRELGYTIHPSIPLSSLSSNPRIADTATGTGAWLLQVSRAHPTATCHGFDISLTQTPPSAWLPKNVSSRIGSRRQRSRKANDPNPRSRRLHPL